jgi:hypothetical protein
MSADFGETCRVFNRRRTCVHGGAHRRYDDRVVRYRLRARGRLRRAARSQNILVGLILLVVGIIITAVASYIIAWGPMLYGGIRLFKGLAS